MSATDHLFAGFDLGTSAVRLSVVSMGAVETEFYIAPYTGTDGTIFNTLPTDASVWWNTVLCLLSKIKQPGQIRAIAVDGTATSVVATDVNGVPVAPALLYYDQTNTRQTELLKSIAPPADPVQNSGSSLGKFLRLLHHNPRVHSILHQSDFINRHLAGRVLASDYNTCLKLGYDPELEAWPAWIEQVPVPATLLPKVVSPGHCIGTLSKSIAVASGLNPETQIVSGTTDSTAAVYATGLREVGDALTSLGSTLVVKIVSDRRIDAPQYGVYSHRYGKHWLVGGASNSGGAVLKSLFTGEQLDTLSAQIDWRKDTELDYYPLLKTGERFPINAPDLAPRLTPRPPSDVDFLHALLEGISNIEARAYQLLAQLGAPKVQAIVTVGGGSKNSTWAQMRQRLIGVPIRVAAQQQAAYGSALLALRAFAQNL